MKIFDKAQWHIDGGEDKAEVIAKFTAIFSFLKEENFLNKNGLEIFALGIDSSVSLNDNLLTEAGNKFISSCYDDLINFTSLTILDELKKHLQ